MISNSTSALVESSNNAVERLLEASSYPWGPPPPSWKDSPDEWDRFQAEKLIRQAAKQLEEEERRKSENEDGWRKRVEEWRQNSPEFDLVADLKAQGLPAAAFDAAGNFFNSDDVPIGGIAAISLFGLAALVVIPEEGGKTSLAKIGAKDAQDTAAIEMQGRTYLLYRDSIDFPCRSRRLGPGLYLKRKGGIPAPDGERARWLRRADEFDVATLPEYVKTAEPISQDEEPFSHGPAQRVNLAGVVQDGVKPPEYLYPDVVCRGNIHAIQSEPHEGKTYAAAAVALSVAKSGGLVMWMDEENTPEDIASLLQDMGASAEDLERIPYYSAPATSSKMPSVSGASLMP